jgi:hypothetical protein
MSLAATMQSDAMRRSGAVSIAATMQSASDEEERRQ